MRGRLHRGDDAAPLLPAPAPALAAVVVVRPRRGTADRRLPGGAAGPAGVGVPWEIIVVLDDCTDATADLVAAAAARCAVPIEAVAGPGRGVGAARARGMDLGLPAPA